MTTDQPSDAIAESEEFEARFQQLSTPNAGAEQRALRFARTAPQVLVRRRLRNLATMLIALLASGAGTATAARVGGWRIGGIDLSFAPKSATQKAATEPTPTQPTVTIALPGSATVWPGEPVTLEEAAERYNAHIRLPKRLRAPSSMYWMTPPASGQITAIWKPQKDLPSTSNPKIGLIVSQFRGTAQDQWVIMKKTGSSGQAPRIEKVRLRKGTGWFLSGPNHLVAVANDTGLSFDHARLATNTLLWSIDGYTYRLEANFTKATAIALADSMK